MDSKKQEKSQEGNQHQEQEPEYINCQYFPSNSSSQQPAWSHYPYYAPYPHNPEMMSATLAQGPNWNGHPVFGYPPMPGGPFLINVEEGFVQGQYIGAGPPPPPMQLFHEYLQPPYVPRYSWYTPGPVMPQPSAPIPRYCRPPPPRNYLPPQYLRPLAPPVLPSPINMIQPLLTHNSPNKEKRHTPSPLFHGNNFTGVSYPNYMQMRQPMYGDVTTVSQSHTAPITHSQPVSDPFNYQMPSPYYGEFFPTPALSPAEVGRRSSELGEDDVDLFQFQPIPDYPDPSRREVGPFTSTPDPRRRHRSGSYPKVAYKGCGFCRSNGESKEVWSSHRVKTFGKTTCPYLRKYVCPGCQATGDDAHTIGKCPNSGQSGFLVRTGRTSTGSLTYPKTRKPTRKSKSESGAKE